MKKIHLRGFWEKIIKKDISTIQNILSNSHKKEKYRIENQIINIKEFNVHPLDHKYKKKDSGLYFLFDNNGKLAYIGKSKNISKRVKQHFKKSDFSNISHYSFIKYPKGLSRLKDLKSLQKSMLEMNQISYYLPYLNIRGNYVNDNDGKHYYIFCKNHGLGYGYSSSSFSVFNPLRHIFDCNCKTKIIICYGKILKWKKSEPKRLRKKNKNIVCTKKHDKPFGQNIKSKGNYYWCEYCAWDGYLELFYKKK